MSDEPGAAVLADSGETGRMGAMTVRSDLVSIHMACNDPANGNFVGRVSQIEVASGMLELTARAWSPCPKLREEDRTFILAGKRWPFVRRQSWVGNWCWDGYALTRADATDFLVWLHRRNLFTCEGGWVELCDAWETEPPLRLPAEWWKI